MLQANAEKCEGERIAQREEKFRRQDEKKERKRKSGTEKNARNQKVLGTSAVPRSSLVAVKGVIHFGFLEF
jgi:hypothetical protein